MMASTRRQAEAFVGGQERERARLTIQREQVIVADVGPQFDAIGDAQVADQRVEILMRMRAVFADDDEPGAGKARGDAGERSDQVIDVTAVEDRSDASGIRLLAPWDFGGGGERSGAGSPMRRARAAARRSEVDAQARRRVAWRGRIEEPAGARRDGADAAGLDVEPADDFIARERRQRQHQARAVGAGPGRPVSRRRPSRPLNHSGCAQNDTSWTDTTTGTREKIGPHIPGRTAHRRPT